MTASVSRITMALQVPCHIVLILRLAICLAAALSSAYAQISNDFANRILALAGPAKPAPLTGKERFHLFLLNTVGPVPLVGEAAGAGIQQWMNTPPQWGQGLSGFATRLGSDMAYNAVRQSITYGASVALHEDTRYFASQDKGAWHRTRHALISTFTAHRDDGSVVFSVSSTAGVIGAAGISSLWSPPIWKGRNNIARNAGISFASTAGFNVLREFWSDILQRKGKQ